MKSNVELIAFLQVLLESKSPIRQELIKAFQNRVWGDENSQDESLNATLSEIAYDLDFYESNEEWRKESPSYYGDDRLEEIIKIAIQKLNQPSPI